MPHPLVSQLRFARSEFTRALADLADADARRRILPMNCISWNIGHLAWQEQRYWLQRAQGYLLLPEINAQFAYGAPASTPSLDDMWAAWRAITQACDPWLDTVTTQMLQQYLTIDGQPSRISFGSLLQRPYRREYGHPAAARPHRSAGVRGRYRRRGALQAEIEPRTEN
jgi:hypothetical protein